LAFAPSNTVIIHALQVEEMVAVGVTPTCVPDREGETVGVILFVGVAVGVRVVKGVCDKEGDKLTLGVTVWVGVCEGVLVWVGVWVGVAVGVVVLVGVTTGVLLSEGVVEMVGVI
jgi:hypothetical protein